MGYWDDWEFTRRIGVQDESYHEWQQTIPLQAETWFVVHFTKDKPMGIVDFVSVNKHKAYEFYSYLKEKSKEKTSYLYSIKANVKC